MLTRLRVPRWAEVSARLQFLAQWKALPGWLVIALGALRTAFGTWSEVEFAWQKLAPYAMAVVAALLSPAGLFSLGIAWLTFLVLRPVKVGEASVAINVPPPAIALYDGHVVTLMVQNIGASKATFYGVAQIERASFDFRVKHPFQLQWMEGKSSHQELDPGQMGRLIVAKHEYGDETYAYVHISGFSGLDNSSWTLDETHPTVDIRMRIDLVVDEVPAARRLIRVRLKGRRDREMVTAKLIELKPEVES